MKSQTEKYEEIIWVLENYVAGVNALYDTITNASKSCVEMFGFNHPSLYKKEEQLQRNLHRIQSATNQIEELIRVLKVEKDNSIDGVPPKWYLEQHPEWYKRHGN